MLKHIDTCISPDLLKVLMEMGHGDEIVLADANFPANSHTDNCIRLDGNDLQTVLKGVTKLIPLDTYVDCPVILMMHGSEIERPIIWDSYEKIITEANEPYKVLYLDRHAFYERAKKAYAIVATSDINLYANIILKKGVIFKE